MYTLTPSQNEDFLFFRLEGEAVERHGAIGYLRADFGKDGCGFWTTWFDSQPHLKTPGFKKEFEAVINSLRDSNTKQPFASSASLRAFCAETPSKSLTMRGQSYVIQTEDYSYYFRCLSNPIDYDIYCFAFDNRYLLPELAGQHELPQYCFSILPSSGEMIRIVRGEAGYYPCNSTGLSQDNIRIKVNDKNQMRGITRAQEEAMLAGSMFGWDAPAANPLRYEKDGRPRTLALKKAEHER